jgi:hypothetical protein
MGTAHVKGDFVSVPIQQLHIGCLVTAQQRHLAQAQTTKQKAQPQTAGSTMQDALLISERVMPSNQEDLYGNKLMVNAKNRWSGRHCSTSHAILISASMCFWGKLVQLIADCTDRHQKVTCHFARSSAPMLTQASCCMSDRLQLQLNLRRRILRIRCEYDLFPSLKRPLLDQYKPCVTKIEAKFKLVHEALQPVVVSEEEGPSVPKQQKALAFTLLQPPRISRYLGRCGQGRCL